MPINLFRPRESPTQAGSDDDAEKAIRNIKTIRTAPVVTGFKKLEDREVERIKKEAEKRKKYSKNFQQYLKSVEIIEACDAEDNQALMENLSVVHGLIVKKRAARTALFTVMEKNKLPQAKAEWTLKQVSQQVDESIRALQSTKKEQDRRPQHKPPQRPNNEDW